MEVVVPWTVLMAVIEAYHPKAGRHANVAGDVCCVFIVAAMHVSSDPAMERAV